MQLKNNFNYPLKCHAFLETANSNKFKGSKFNTIRNFLQPLAGRWACFSWISLCCSNRPFRGRQGSLPCKFWLTGDVVLTVIASYDTSGTDMEEARDFNKLLRVKLCASKNLLPYHESFHLFQLPDRI